MASGPSYYNDSDGDIYFVTTDNIKFQVSRSILSHASITFRDMFQASHLPEGNAEGDVAFPIKIDADALVFDTVLRLIYPVAPPGLINHSKKTLLSEVLAFSMKYMLEHVVARLRHELVSSAYLTHDPLRAYCIACKWDWKEEQSMATKSIIKSYDFYSIIPHIPEMDEIPASKITQLFNINRAFRQFMYWQIRGVLERNPKMYYKTDESDREIWAPRCICNPEMPHPYEDDIDGYRKGPPNWFRVYMEKVDQLLNHREGPLPISRFASLELMHEVGTGSACTGCTSNMLTHWSRIQRIPETLMLYIDSLTDWNTLKRQLQSHMQGFVSV